MDVVDMAKALIGEGADEARINVLAEIVTVEACAYCNCDAMPPEANGTLAQMVVQKYNRQGSEGAASESYSGVSESYIDGYPAEIRSALSRWRRMVVV